jgi:hypothetical protein
MSTEVISIAEQRDLTLLPFVSAGEQDTEDLVQFILHAGIRCEEVEAHGGDVQAAILAHYWTGSGYAWERVAESLVTYPPVQARLRELQEEKRQTAARDRARKAAKKGRGKRAAEMN